MTIQQQVHITRQQVDAASAVEREARNALVRATNAYCASAETQHDYNIMERRFKRTKAGAALLATWREAKRIQDASIKASSAALNQFWSGFGFFMDTTSLAHMFNHGEQETELYQQIEGIILAAYPPVETMPTEETTMTNEYTPNPRAVIAKVDGDTQVMQYEYIARTDNSPIDLLRRLHGFLSHKQAQLVAIDDKTSTAATKAQMWITAIEGKIVDAEMSFLEYFEERELTETPAQPAAPDDILAQLGYINSHDHGYAAQQIAHAATDEIRRLRAEVEAYHRTSNALYKAALNDAVTVPSALTGFIADLAKMSLPHAE